MKGSSQKSSSTVATEEVLSISTMTVFLLVLLYYYIKGSFYIVSSFGCSSLISGILSFDHLLVPLCSSIISVKKYSVDFSDLNIDSDLARPFAFLCRLLHLLCGLYQFESVLRIHIENRYASSATQQYHVCFNIICVDN